MFDRQLVKLAWRTYFRLWCLFPHLVSQLLCEHPRLGQRYEPIDNREVRETSYGHYRIAYLIVSETRIDVLGVFHASMDIERYLR